jgi:hypothetical protein
MVKKLSRFFAYTLFFILALIAFTPKESFYFLLEKNLQKFDVVISNESLEDRLFTLEIRDLALTAQGIDTAEVGEADIMLLLFYNSVTMQNIQVSSLIDAYAPAKIDSLELNYTIFNPLVVTARADGEFGEAKVVFDILHSKLRAVVEPSKMMLSRYKKTMRMMKKDENGEYVYAKTF